VKSTWFKFLDALVFCCLNTICAEHDPTSRFVLLSTCVLNILKLVMPARIHILCLSFRSQVMKTVYPLKKCWQVQCSEASVIDSTVS
jgi:hypothetical protein